MSYASIRRHDWCALSCGTTLLVFLLIAAAFGGDSKSVRFASDPGGAQVELQGRILCTTPCSFVFPDYYFKKHFTYWSKRLSEPLKVRFTKPGYIPRDVIITVGPLRWQAWNTPDYFDYYRINDEVFEVRLDPAKEFFASTSSPPISDVLRKGKFSGGYGATGYAGDRSSRVSC